MASFTAHLNPSVSQAVAVGDATSLNNMGRSLYNQKRYAEAEAMYKQSLEVKLAHFGANSQTVAIAYNALGEVYIKLRRLDEAKENLQRAIAIVTDLNNVHDIAYYRENLAKVHEMKGDLPKARDERLRGTSTNIMCGNDDCPVFPMPVPVKHCSRCQSIYYCSPQCQKTDWRRHKVFCRAPSN